MKVFTLIPDYTYIWNWSLDIREESVNKNMDSGMHQGYHSVPHVPYSELETGKVTE